MRNRRDPVFRPLAQSNGSGDERSVPRVANQARGEVALVVEGRSYLLRPSFNASCELETLTNKAYTQWLIEAHRGRLDAMRALMWAFLHECHGEEIRTLADAGEWIVRAGGLEVISRALEQVTAVNAPAEGDGAANPPSAQAGTGGTASSPPVAAGSRRTGSGRARRGSTTTN